nr:alginate lyase family protein [Paraburkholderia sp. Ac-20340]
MRWLLCSYALALSPAWAGPVSLEPDQVSSLRSLIKQDSEATALYEQQKRMAVGALSDDPKPVPVLVGEGRLDSDPDKIRSDSALKDMQKISALAWVWLVSQDARFADKGTQFILAWARVNRPDGDPINETKLEPLIVGYDVLRQRFTPTDRVTVDGWLRDQAITLWNDPRHRTENWQSHRLKIVGLIATTLDDDALWRQVTEGFKVQMDRSFLPDGESTDFQLRDAMHYNLYSVEPLLTLACVAHQRHHDWYDYQAPSGASLRRAVDFIKPYALGEKKHIDFAHSKVNFDQVRSRAGEGEYSRHQWSTCEAGPVFSGASCVDPDAGATAVKVWCGAPHKRFVDWQSVVNAVKSGS